MSIINKHNLMHQLHKDGKHEYDVYSVSHPDKGDGYALYASAEEHWRLDVRGQIRALVLDAKEYLCISAESLTIPSMMDYGSAEELHLLLAYYYRTQQASTSAYALIKPVCDGVLSVFES